MWVRAGNGRPNKTTFVRLSLLQPGFQFTLSIRIQELMQHIPVIGKVLRRLLWFGTTMFFGSEISIGAKIGSGVYFPHPWGIVIGDGVLVGKNVSIFQHTTLGRSNFAEKQVPTVMNDVTIYAGATIIGSIILGEKSVIGANSVVFKDVPAHYVVAGNPASVIKKTL